jgi:predicted DNA-binding ribbon-helix-helix protein
VSVVVKRSLSIRGHRTSISLEQPFFDALHHISGERGLSLAGLIAEIDAQRPRNSNLSSALRVFVLRHFQDLATGEHDDRTFALPSS